MVVPECLRLWAVVAHHLSIRAAVCLVQILVVCIWGFVVMPLTLVGAVLGRNMSGSANVPCRVNPVPRPIPEKKW